MKRIVLCFDGTWNKPADEHLPEDRQVETNVSRFYDSVLAAGPDGVKQVKWYDEGVGTQWFDRFAGGAFGTGLDLKILEGYKQLAAQYENGDEIYVLGFSRGAYTARSLVGMIRNCGLIKPEHLDLRVGMAYGIYRTRDDGPDSKTARLFRSLFSREIEIKFVGVWDTVGALGVPLPALKDVNLKLYEFHDLGLSAIVRNAYHALAVDEHRNDYSACLWDPDEKPQQTLEQRWFIGAHCDAGGGYSDRRLSDITLRWMQDKASGSGLGLKPVDVAPANYLGPYSDSYTDFLKGVYAKLNPPHYRAIGATRFGNESVDDSARRRRREDVKYVPQNAGFPTMT